MQKKTVKRPGTKERKGDLIKNHLQRRAKEGMRQQTRKGNFGAVHQVNPLRLLHQIQVLQIIRQMMRRERSQE